MSTTHDIIAMIKIGIHDTPTDNMNHPEKEEILYIMWF
jgi:hypothetical protein